MIKNIGLFKIILVSLCIGSQSSFANEDLLKRWEQINPSIMDEYNHLSDKDKAFIVVYRGIDKVPVESIWLDQRGKSFAYGPTVFTSTDPSVAVIYAGSDDVYGDDLSCNVVILKMSIPLGFFDSSDKIQNTISTNKPFADLRLFITEVGFKSKELLSINGSFPPGGRIARLKNFKWIPYDQIINSSGKNLKTPKGCGNQ